MVLTTIGFTKFFGLSVIAWFGLATLVSLIATAVIGYLNARGNRSIPFGFHKKLAFLTISLALIHAALALATQLG